MLLSSSVYRQVSSRVSSYWTWGQRQGGRSILPRARAAQPRSLRRSLPGPPAPRPVPSRPGDSRHPVGAELPVRVAASCPRSGTGEQRRGAGSPGPSCFPSAPRAGRGTPGRRRGRERPVPAPAPPGASRGEPGQPQLGTVWAAPAAAGVAASGERPGCTVEAVSGRGDRGTVPRQRRCLAALPRPGGCARARGRRGRAGGPSGDPARGAERARTGHSLSGSVSVPAPAPRPATAARRCPGLPLLPAGAPRLTWRPPALPRSRPGLSPTVPASRALSAAAAPQAAPLSLWRRCRRSGRAPTLGAATPPSPGAERPRAAPPAAATAPSPAACCPLAAAPAATERGERRLTAWAGPAAAALFLKVPRERKRLKAQNNLFKEQPLWCQLLFLGTLLAGGHAMQEKRLGNAVHQVTGKAATKWSQIHELTGIRNWLSKPCTPPGQTL